MGKCSAQCCLALLAGFGCENAGEASPEASEGCATTREAPGWCSGGSIPTPSLVRTGDGRVDLLLRASAGVEGTIRSRREVLESAVGALGAEYGLDGSFGFSALVRDLAAHLDADAAEHTTTGVRIEASCPSCSPPPGAEPSLESDCVSRSQCPSPSGCVGPCETVEGCDEAARVSAAVTTICTVADVRVSYTLKAGVDAGGFGARMTRLQSLGPEILGAYAGIELIDDGKALGVSIRETAPLADLRLALAARGSADGSADAMLAPGCVSAVVPVFAQAVSTVEQVAVDSSFRGAEPLVKWLTGSNPCAEGDGGQP